MKLEYGLLIALIASVIVIGLTHIGAEVGYAFEQATAPMSDTANPEVQGAEASNKTQK